MDKITKIKPTTYQNNKEYFYHIIGTLNALKYNKESLELQILFNGVITRRIPNVFLTFEEFQVESKRIFFHVLTNSFFKN